jgi:hypothetical protein
MIDPKQIYTAHFTDNEQTTIEVLLGTEEPGVFESMIIPYNPNEDNCKSVLGIIDMDKLHQNTFRRKKSESEALMALAVNAAQEEGMLDNRYHLIDLLLNDKEQSIEDLFAFKIALFDTEKVKNSPKAMKSKIRKAKTALDAFKIVIA